MTKIHNFSAGPSILPKSAIQEAMEGLQNFKNTGLSVVEISHRSKEWEETMEEMTSLIADLFSIPTDKYDIFFLGGGASLQFTMIPQNLLSDGSYATYLKTGVWAANAAKEAKFWGDVKVIASSEDKNYSYIPKGYDVPQDAAYFHITTNNTIFGTQLKDIPNAGSVPIVADMSSDIFSRPIDIKQYGMIYAGAQKNMGPAGVTLLILRKDMLGLSKRPMPTMMNYETHIKSGSMYNTPPVFPIYLSYCTLKWLKGLGGVTVMQKMNEDKAKILYDEIDRNQLFVGTTAVEDRSLMNVTFVCNNPDNEKAFLQLAESEGISGIKGHRSVGGFRASLYNALPKESVSHLVEVMKEFERTR